MKKQGIINGNLARALAQLRHTDLFVIADAGFPAGPREQVIDLAVIPGLPRFADVLTAVLAEATIEESWIASEVGEVNHEQARFLGTSLPHAKSVPHYELKMLSTAARFVVRTGDATPYSNVLLQAGYPF